MSRGRPSLYTPELADEICRRIALGEPVYKIAKDPAMPSHNAIWEWRSRHKDFGDKYAKAKADAMELMAEEILDIADSGGENPAHTRIRVDTRKWLMSKLAAKKYGDTSNLNVEVKHSLADMLVQLNQRRQSGEDEPRLIGEGTGDE